MLNFFNLDNRQKVLIIEDLRHSSPSFNYQNVYQWGDIHPKCYGKMQSPINIEPSKISVIYKPSLLKFEGYDVLPETMNLKTNEHTGKSFSTINLKKSCLHSHSR